MGYYEQSNTENSRGNRSTATRNSVFNKISNSIMRETTEKKAKEREMERYETQGNGKYIMTGSNDRVNGIDFRGHLYKNEDDSKSYYYGYIHHGGRRLFAIVEELVKEGKLEEVALIAERDYNHDLEKGHLGMVENNSVYMEAFDKIASKGKSR